MILEVCNLQKSFKDFSLDKINFSLEKGYVMGFVGPNGAGKSTTIKLMMNLLHKDSGDIRIFGMDHVQNETAVKDRIGFVFDENYFYEELTVSETGWLFGSMYSRWDKDAFRKYIRDFALLPRKKIKELSKGMKMKLSLAVALSHQAELFIMDEPTSGLDPIVRSELLEILRELLQDESKAVFFSTHITSDLEKIADFITFIHEGKIVFSKTREEISENYALIRGGRELLSEEIKQNFVGLKENAFGFEGLYHNAQAAKKVFGETAVIERPTLDDIMLYHVRGRQNV